MVGAVSVRMFSLVSTQRNQNTKVRVPKKVRNIPNSKYEALKESRQIENIKISLRVSKCKNARHHNQKNKMNIKKETPKRKTNESQYTKKVGTTRKSPKKSELESVGTPRESA